MPKLPSKPLTKEQLAKLQAKWYKRANGTRLSNGVLFKDIEHGRDLNNMAGQTFRQSGNDSVMLWDFSDGKSWKDGTGFHVHADADNGHAQLMIRHGGDNDPWDHVSDFRDHPKFEYYDRIVTYAGSLPEDDTTRRFLLLAVQTSRTKAAKKVRISMTQATSIWQATLQQLGLPDGRRGPGKREAAKATEPASPVRILKREEIAKLQYKSPKQIKDGTDE